MLIVLFAPRCNIRTPETKMNIVPVLTMIEQGGRADLSHGAF